MGNINTMIDIEHLKKTVGSRMNNHDKMWKEAFRQYNEANEKKLGMGCRPCFFKVLQFHIQKEKVTA